MTTATEQQPPGTKDRTVALLADDSSYVIGQIQALNGGLDM